MNRPPGHQPQLRDRCRYGMGIGLTEYPSCTLSAGRLERAERHILGDGIRYCVGVRRYKASHLHLPAEKYDEKSIQQLHFESERASKKFALVREVERRGPLLRTYLLPPLGSVVQTGHIPPSPPPRRSSLAGTALLVPACRIPTDIHNIRGFLPPLFRAGRVWSGCLLPYEDVRTAPYIYKRC